MQTRTYTCDRCGNKLEGDDFLSGPTRQYSPVPRYFLSRLGMPGCAVGNDPDPENFPEVHELCRECFSALVLLLKSRAPSSSN